MVDEGARKEVEAELKEKLGKSEEGLKAIAEPVIKERLKAFRKPHLFFKDNKMEIRCKCCACS